MAYVSYKEKDIEAARWFINEAVKKAKESLKNDEVDKEIVDEIIELQRQIDKSV